MNWKLNNGIPFCEMRTIFKAILEEKLYVESNIPTALNVDGELIREQTELCKLLSNRLRRHSRDIIRVNI